MDGNNKDRSEEVPSTYLRIWPRTYLNGETEFMMLTPTYLREGFNDDDDDLHLKSSF